MNINTSNSFNLAQQGLQRSQNDALAAAQSIASPARLGGSAEPSAAGPTEATRQPQATLEPLAEPIIKLQQSQQLFDASARVLEVSDSTVGALLDVSA